MYLCFSSSKMNFKKYILYVKFKFHQLFLIYNFIYLFFPLIGFLHQTVITDFVIMSDSDLKRSITETETSTDDSVPSKKLCKTPLISNKDSEVLSENSVSVKPEDTENDVVRATENDVGITEFISDYPGFSATMKER